MKRFSKIFSIIFFSFCFLAFSFNFVSAGFAEYNDSIKTVGYSQAEKKCESGCPTDGPKYYQLTTGVPFLGANATRCACIPVSSGIQFFLTGIIKFALGSVATIATIIIIVAGFRWGFSAGNKSTIVKSKEMITNAVIGLVMTLTCGLMLRVVNPTLLTNNTLTIEPVIIEKGVDRVSKGLPIGSLCNESRNSLCSSDLKCASISACKMDTVEGDGVCIYPNSKLVCLKGSCKTDETVTYCAPQVMNYNVTQKTFCIDGVCEYNNPNKPATNSSAPLVGGGELCSVSSDAQNSCVAGYKCLSCISTNSANGIECKKDGKGNDGESRCYPETCKKIIPVAPSSPENTYCSSSNCCMYPFVCGKDNVCENK